MERTSRGYEFQVPASEVSDQSEKLNVSLLWEGLKEATTSHGIPHLETAKGFVKKVFWLLIVLLCFAGLLYNLYQVFKAYRRFDVNFRVYFAGKEYTIFPAVTVCNMCAIKKSALEHSPSLQSVLKEKVRKKRESPHSRQKRSDHELTCDTASGVCFTLYHPTNKFNYDDAKERCASIGMTLAVFDLDWLSAWAIGRGSLDSAGSDSWLGLRKVGDDYEWEPTSTTVKNERWNRGQPDTTKDCATIVKSGWYRWRTNDCSEEHLAYCSTTAGQTTVSTTTDPPSTSPNTEVISSTTMFTSSSTEVTPSTTDVMSSTTQITTQTTTDISEYLPTTTEEDSSQVITPVADMPVSPSETSSTGIPATSTPFQTSGGSSIPTSLSTVGTPQTESTAFHATPDVVPKTVVPTSAAPLPTEETPNVESEWSSSYQDPKPIPGSRFPDRIQTRESFQLEEEVTELLADMPEEEKQKLGFKRSEFILTCIYDGLNCKEDFSFFYNTIHGNCYTFNSGWTSNVSLHPATKTGPRHGLTMIINVVQDEYVESLADSAGVRVVIHEQTKMPHPEEQGILATPGYVTSVGVKKVKMSRLGPPYGQCIDPALPRPRMNVYEEIFPVHYSSMACYKTCYQRHVIKKCGCADPLVPKYGKAFNYVDVKTCSIRNITQDDCLYEADKMYRENELQCDCPDSCNDSTFLAVSTRGLWPSNIYKERLEEKVSFMVPGYFSNKTDPRKYERNLVKLEVYLQDLKAKVVEEEAAYGMEKLLSDFGGLFGLFAGFTVMTFFEFMEFFLDLLVLSCIRRKNRRISDLTAVKETKLVTKEETKEVGDTSKRRKEYLPSAVHPSPSVYSEQNTQLFDFNY